MKYPVTDKRTGKTVTIEANSPEEAKAKFKQGRSEAAAVSANPAPALSTGGQSFAGQEAAPEQADHGILKTIASTLREIPEGMVKAGSGLAEWEADKVAQLMRFLGAPEGVVGAAENFRDQQFQPEEIEAWSDEQVNKVLPQSAEGPVRSWTQHQPQNETEEGVAAVTGFLPALLTKNPQGMSGVPALVRKGFSRVLAPAAVTEKAGDVTGQIAPEYENAVRMVVGAISSPQTLKSADAVIAAALISKSRAAMEALRLAVINDFGNSPQSFARAQAALDELGIANGATLMDIGPNLKQGGQQIYAKPGTGQEAIHQKLTTRDEGYGQRFEQDVRGNVGPKVDEDLVIRALDERGAEGARKQRESHPQQQAPAELDPIIDDIDSMLATERGSKLQSTLKDVRRMLTIDKTAADQPDVSQTASEPILKARQAIKDMLWNQDGTPTSIGGGEAGILKNIYAKINKALDPANPELRRADAEIEQVGKERSAFQTGKEDVLRTDPNTALSPESFARQWDTLGTAEKAKLREGLTAKIDAIRGTTSNERAALKRIVLGEGKWNHQKIAQIIGQTEADNLVRGMKREATFQDTKSQVLHGSKTAGTQTFDQQPAFIEGAKSAIDRTAAGGAVAGATGAAVGLAIAPFKAGLDKLGNAVTATKRAELGRLLSSGKPDDVLRAIRLLENSPGGRKSALYGTLMARKPQEDEKRRRGQFDLQPERARR